jgi:hypothetical protein
MKGTEGVPPLLPVSDVQLPSKMLQDVCLSYAAVRFGTYLYTFLLLAINKVVQSGSWVGICSASVGGQPDEPDGTKQSFCFISHTLKPQNRDRKSIQQRRLSYGMEWVITDIIRPSS